MTGGGVTHVQVPFPIALHSGVVFLHFSVTPKSGKRVKSLPVSFTL